MENTQNQLLIYEKEAESARVTVLIRYLRCDTTQSIKL